MPPSKSLLLTLFTLATAAADELSPGVKLFNDREYVALEVPAPVLGKPFLRSSIEKTDIEVTKAGTIYALTGTLQYTLTNAGFTKVEGASDAHLFKQDQDRVSLFSKDVQPGQRLRVFKYVILIPGTAEIKEHVVQPPGPWTENNGETLYNGIVLPKVWPPEHLDPKSTEPMPVPYLDHPPKVIPIDLGRQLFVDDFLIEQTDLQRTYHKPVKYAGNPVFKAETTRELGPATEGEKGEEAMMFTGQGGIFWDPGAKHFKLFHVAGWRGPLSLATSTDMKTWTRPDLGLAGGNALLPEGLAWQGPVLKNGGSDNCIWLDLNAKDPAERYKFLTCWEHVPKDQHPPGFRHSLHVTDLKTWSPGKPTGMAGDYCSFFYNPFRETWVYSIKQGGPRGRSRYYSENKDFLAGADYSRSVYWTNADKLDLPEPEGSYPNAGEPTQLYSLNAVAYESLFIGMHYIHRGPRNEICDAGKFPKLTDLEAGFSRDGFHWHRPDRTGFIRGERKEGSWERGYMHGAAGVFVVLNDQLVFPYMGTSGVAPSGKKGMYSGGSIGLATLRRDGFASLDGAGSVTTRPVTFKGRHLFVNVKGDLRAEVIGADGKAIGGFSKENCVPVKVDSTKQAVTWNGADLATLAGQPVRFRFHLADGQFYAFWVSGQESGASGGYVGAGGPDFQGVRDL